MSDRTCRTVPANSTNDAPRLSRRRCLESAAIGLLWAPITAIAAPPDKKSARTLSKEEERIVSEIRNIARKAGLGEFRVEVSQHFLSVGDGPARYGAEALDRCEAIARDFFKHFRHLGIPVEFPARHLIVVTLKDARSYQRFSGEEQDATVGGYYDPDANWLVIFDFRPDQGKSNAEAKRINTFTLVHETIHLLCYNTGLHSPQADVPAAISEGLATYGELWTPARGSSAFGMVNQPRLLGLLQQETEGNGWIPVERLLADDELFRNPETTHRAYGEAWLLTHLLLDTPERRPKSREYLAGTPKLGEKDAAGRVAYAKSKFGPLDDLDRAVRRHGQRMLKRANLRVPAGLIQGRG